MPEKVIRKTLSFCPVCRQKIPAEYFQRDDNTVVFHKICPVHGSCETTVWKGTPSFEEWTKDWDPLNPGACICPEGCGLCRAHGNRTCCALLDVTTRCNLGCPVCFAASGQGEDLPMVEIMTALEDMYDRGIRYLHLSGGEPTVHPKLPKIIAYAKKLGYEYIQLNTNGLRLAEDPAYAQELADAGLSSVFLQFDGTSDEIYKRIRGRELITQKKRAIENCDRAFLGVVLVPTLIQGINTGDIGNIIRFALERMPAVRGIHFQPIMYSGRYPGQDDGRVTMPELMEMMETQTDGMLKITDFLPSACDSPLCGLHAEYRMEEDGLCLIRNASSPKGCCSTMTRSTENNQRHVRSKWTRSKPEKFEEGTLDALLWELENKSFGISAMAFQDLYTLDVERLMECSIHVYEKGRLVPFCVYHNLKGG